MPSIGGSLKKQLPNLCCVNGDLKSLGLQGFGFDPNCLKIVATPTHLLIGNGVGEKLLFAVFNDQNVEL